MASIDYKQLRELQTKGTPPSPSSLCQELRRSCPPLPSPLRMVLTTNSCVSFRPRGHPPSLDVDLRRSCTPPPSPLPQDGIDYKQLRELQTKGIRDIARDWGAKKRERKSRLTEVGGGGGQYRGGTEVWRIGAAEVLMSRLAEVRGRGGSTGGGTEVWRRSTQGLYPPIPIWCLTLPHMPH